MTGAPAVCLATGRPLPGNPPGQAYEYLLDSLDSILDYAEECGIRVGIEYEPELLVECTEEVLALIEDVGRDSLGVNLDVGHAAVYGEDPAEAIRQSAGHITGVHLEDIVGGVRGKHYHRIPGEGDLDFRAIFDALDDIDYGGGSPRSNSTRIPTSRTWPPARRTRCSRRTAEYSTIHVGKIVTNQTHPHSMFLRIFVNLVVNPRYDLLVNELK